MQTRVQAVSRDTVLQEKARESVAFTTASHEVLFSEVTERRCDVCGTALAAPNGDEPPTGVYVWARGDEVRREEAPLCETCSTAIFGSALDFEFDDEE
jgi:hypothetical protein